MPGKAIDRPLFEKWQLVFLSFYWARAGVG